MLKRHCKGRAEWRLQLGKPTERLSAHYRLDCDYGTPIVVCWEEGGSEPINLCEKHAKELERSGEKRSSTRAMTPAPISHPAHVDNSAGGNDQTEPREVVHERPKHSVPLETASSLDDTNTVRATAVRTTAVRAAKDSSVRSPLRDLTYGNPVKALVDETIWNMATGDHDAYRSALREGKSVAEAARAAGGQLAMVHRKIGDCALKLVTVLSESKAVINVRDVIDRPLEEELLEIIGKDAIGESEKDAAIQQLGTLEEWVKQGLNVPNGNVTPAEAHRIIRAIGDRLNWGGSANVSEELKPAYRALFTSLKNAIYSAVPEAQNLHERLTNLYAAKSELENTPMTRELNPLTA